MIVVLDASAAISIALQQDVSEPVMEYIKNANWVIAPDLFVSEVTNVFWKYHHFESLPLEISEIGLDNAISLVDDFISSQELYREAFSLACQTNHPVYDMMYLVCARRHNGIFLSLDTRLNKLAHEQSIKIAGQDDTNP